ncbi:MULTISPECIES: MBL fold metallo-hydrolase RNA specificity domain-containing protein, partial [Pseudomonas]|uniref:MBL fold metallo-hydrolase RNA specificity domain-containing protein n=1 Tax=Pseudomonas TaxID=286 RepID=UPI002F26B12A
SGRMRVEWVAGSPWNRWSDAHGMGGQMTVKSAVMTLGGYSGHADQAQLVAFAHGCNARRVVLVHGEKKAKQTLAAALRGKFALSGDEVCVTVPK